MIIYKKTKEDFSNDILTNNIGNIICNHILDKTGKKVAPNEVRSFENSLSFMERVLNDSAIPDDCTISIEYHLPQTSKRVDFIISGKDGDKENVIIVELKQWQESKITTKDGIVKTRFNLAKQKQVILLTKRGHMPFYFFLLTLLYMKNQLLSTHVLTYIIMSPITTLLMIFIHITLKRHLFF